MRRSLNDLCGIGESFGSDHATPRSLVGSRRDSSRAARETCYQPHTDHTETEPLVATFVVTARKY